MRCPNCEKLNPDGAQHCAYCGAPLAPATSSSSPRAQRPREGVAPVVPPPARRRRPLLWGVLALLLLAIAATALITHALSGSSPQPPVQAAAPPAAVVTRIVTVQVPVTVTVLVPVTATPAPATATPASTVLAQATQSPSPSASGDTPPGTILEVGQTWRQDGLELNLTRVDLYTDGIAFHFKLTNQRTIVTVFRFVSGDTFTVTDNDQRRLALDDAGRISTFTLDPSASADLGHDCCPAFEYARTDTTQSDVTNLVITVNGISSITNARWHFPIHH